MLLEVDAVSKRFAGVAAVDGASLAVERGEIVGIVGPNGSGKSTLLNAMSGFTRVDSGSVTLDGTRIDRAEPWTIARLGLRRTFQLAKLPMRMTVVEVMVTGASLPIGSSALRSVIRPRRVRGEERAALERADRLLAELELDHLSDHGAGTLSGGQQKLLSLGAALMGDPKLLLLDEPTAGVNPTLRLALIQHLLAVRDSGTTIVVVEHDMSVIGALCDRVYVLDKGRVIACWKPHELAGDPRVVEAYLGVPATSLVEGVS